MSRAPLTSSATVPAARFLEATLVFNFVIHVVAMASMAMLLMPGMPGGGAADTAARVAYIADHSWLWRIGWFPWQLCALADLALGIALVWTQWVPKKPALISVLLTLLAVVPDQYGQALWISRGVRLASEAARSGNLAPYLAFEGPIFRMVGVFGCIGYLLAALGWTWSFAAAGTWIRRLTWLSVAAWGTFAAAIVLYFLPSAGSWVSFANAVGFLLLLAWFIGVTDQVVGRCRPEAPHGRYAAWRHPGRPAIARLANAVANNHFARALAEWIPTPELLSDVHDVVYVNYLVEAERLESLVPEGLELQRLGPYGKYALFTFLTYRHGHFGPRLLGPLRRHLPSPIQSNWRIHVIDPQTSQRGVYFISTLINSTVHALVGRVLSEGVPMHVPRRADLARDASGTVHLSIEPGAGTAPDARATLRPSLDRSLPPAWVECFADFRAFLEYCVPQDRAMSCQPWYDRVTRQEIDLAIPLQSCRRMDGQVESEAARSIVGDAQPVCFYVPAVTFRFAGEQYDPRSVAQDEGELPRRTLPRRPVAEPAPLS